MSVDAVGVTRNQKYVLYEAKGQNVEHGLEQLEWSAAQLGAANVVRYHLVVSNPPRIYTEEGGILHLNGKPVRINGKPVYVTIARRR
jgi:hypothetical protein